MDARKRELRGIYECYYIVQLRDCLAALLTSLDCELRKSLMSNVRIWPPPNFRLLASAHLLSSV